MSEPRPNQLASGEDHDTSNEQQITVGHSNAIISNGLVGYWTFDGPSINWNTNTIADMSGQGNTGTLVSMSTTSSPTPGKIGQAMRFDGSTQRVLAGNAVSLQTPIGTMTAWIKTADAGNSWRGIIAKQNAYGMFLYNNSLDYYDWGGFANHDCGIALNDKKWHFVAISFQSGVTDGTKCYADGNLVYTNSMSVSDQVVQVMIGEANAGNQYFTGDIDDARVYNRVLSPQK